ncbi:hypothetical protein [Gemmobacter caeruleus]|uniref:hypothetical protein n=1 Tax=Gemmobacter caeruleus TaxID=2595004 RepID=UPI0011EEAD6A|nr:hypothetical protein [Gemmobacter caeruleus]
MLPCLTLIRLLIAIARAPAFGVRRRVLAVADMLALRRRLARRGAQFGAAPLARAGVTSPRLCHVPP